MAERRPDSLAVLGTITGVGTRKLAQYGEAFLEVLRAEVRGGYTAQERGASENNALLEPSQPPRRPSSNPPPGERRLPKGRLLAVPSTAPPIPTSPSGCASCAAARQRQRHQRLRGLSERHPGPAGRAPAAERGQLRGLAGPGREAHRGLWRADHRRSSISRWTAERSAGLFGPYPLGYLKKTDQPWRPARSAAARPVCPAGASRGPGEHMNERQTSGDVSFAAARGSLRPAAALCTALALALGACGQAASPAPEHRDLGNNVKVFDPSMSTAAIQAAVDAVKAQQLDAEFGDGRYALLFKPGTYGTPGKAAADRCRLLHRGRRAWAAPRMMW